MGMVNVKTHPLCGKWAGVQSAKDQQKDLCLDSNVHCLIRGWGFGECEDPPTMWEMGRVTSGEGPAKDLYLNSSVHCLNRGWGFGECEDPPTIWEMGLGTPGEGPAKRSVPGFQCTLSDPWMGIW